MKRKITIRLDVDSNLMVIFYTENGNQAFKRETLMELILIGLGTVTKPQAVIQAFNNARNSGRNYEQNVTKPQAVI